MESHRLDGALDEALDARIDADVRARRLTRAQGDRLKESQDRSGSVLNLPLSLPVGLALAGDAVHVTNAERTKGFARRYGDIPISQVDDRIVGEWLAGGRNSYTVPALRAMWNDAMSARAGRIVDQNPWAALGLRKRRRSAWRLDEQARDMLDEQLGCSRLRVSPPTCGSAAGWRCGRLSWTQLKLDDVDLRAGEIHARRQWNARGQDYTDPKYGHTRLPWSTRQGTSSRHARAIATRRGRS